MEHLLLAIIGILLLIIAALLAKIFFLRKSTREITQALGQRLNTETNTLISLSSRDPYMRKLAAELNVQLRLLRKERHRYQQGDRELKEAATNISHDLRTPLTAICGYLDLLERQEKDPEVDRYLAQIRNRTEAMAALTEELFRYSMVTSVQALAPKPTNLVRATEEVLLSFYGAMEERGIQPELALPAEPVWRTLDPEALNRVLANIISNAIKYTDGDFSVTMDEEGSAVFSNGASGLTAVTAGRLFDRFYTVEASRNSTGLGLAIARHLTQEMGGRIWAEFQEGRLSIHLSFPS